MPWGLAVGVDDSLFVSEYGNGRVMRLYEGSTIGLQVAGSTSHGNNLNQLQFPAEVYVDASSNVYVSDDFNYRVMLWRNMSSTGVIVAGNSSNGNTSSTLGPTAGVAVDSQGNIYVSDTGNHRVMKWALNATSGTLVAGQVSIAGNNSNQLNNPFGLYLDELHSHLYIADLGNHRIQRITLDTSTNATTVAGGNGVGAANNQLNTPWGMCVSKKTGTIYIADTGNHRVTRWIIGATSGVTVVGIASQSGTSSMLFNHPANVALSLNETFLYVSDMLNHRVQRFQLI